MVARTEGRERIPSDTVSAIMTVEVVSLWTNAFATEHTHARLPALLFISWQLPNALGPNIPPGHRPVLDFRVGLVTERIVFSLVTHAPSCPSILSIRARLLVARFFIAVTACSESVGHVYDSPSSCDTGYLGRS